MSQDFELILNNVLLALQLCLGVWQFTKITPVGALIKGVVSWLLRPFGLSETYSTLQIFDGRVFKEVNCFVLQPEISSARRGVVEFGSGDRLQLHVRYLGKKFALERRGSDGNMLFVDGKMCYYIIPTVWEELQVLENVTDLVGSVERAIEEEVQVLENIFDSSRGGKGRSYASLRDEGRSYDLAEALAEGRGDALADALAAARDAASDDTLRDALAAAASNPAYAAAAASNHARKAAATARKVPRIARTVARTLEIDPVHFASKYAAANAIDVLVRGAAARSLNLLLALARHNGSVVLKGHREIWEEVSTGGIMSLDEVLDRLILHNQHLSLPLADKWLLPVDLSVSEEKLLKILNLFAVFLETKKEKVHWLIPTSLSFISALLEFSTPLRVWLYTNINVLFCYIMHSMCDLLPRPWRRQVYSLGKWVGDLKPTNDIQLKIQRGNIRAIIAGGAKIDREGVSLVKVPWLNVAKKKHRRDVISNHFPCNSIDIGMTCTYLVPLNKCQIDAPTVSMFTVECRSMEEYRRLITLVSRMANNGCGSLKSWGPHNKVSVRGFRESVLCYVKGGFPHVYELQWENSSELENIVVD